MSADTYVPITPPPPPPPQIINLQTPEGRDDNKCDDKRYYNNVTIDRHDFKQVYSVSMGSVLQTGPNCGLAALSMVSTLTPRFVSIGELYTKAKIHGYTKNGEMFSVKNMVELAEMVLNAYYNIELISGGMVSHLQLIIDNLCKGNILVVPYDADKNNEPCCRKGHAAHWAVVCGLLEHYNGTVYVISRQGKSKYPSVWPILTLAKSNSNLTEVDPKKTVGNQYLVPTGGISESLANQFIILTKRFDRL